MAVFPAISPIYPANKQPGLERSKVALGDGYESSLIFGLNTPKMQWNLIWLVELEQAEQIEGFLQAQADAGDWFEWQPPDSVVPLRFRCDEWTIEQDDPAIYRVSASFKRVFEPEISNLVPIGTICDQDELCSYDYGGTAESSTVWVARLRGTVAGDEGNAGSAYMANAYTFDDGYIFLAYIFNNEINVSKFDQSGTNIWTREYPGLFQSNGYPGNDIIYLAANEAGKRLYLSWQGGPETNIYTPFGAQVFSVACISTATGAFQWGKAFLPDGKWFNALGGWWYTSTTIQGMLELMVYHTSSNRLVISARTSTQYNYSAISVFDGSTGAPLYQRDLNGTGSDALYRDFNTVLHQGYLGSAPYTIGWTGNSGNWLFWPGHSETMPASASRLTGVNETNSSGKTCKMAKFIGNGQILAWFTPGRSATNEIMIIGAGGSINAHVAFPSNSLFGASDGWEGIIASDATWQVYLDTSASRLFIYTQNLTGVNVQEFSVILGGSLITGITALERKAANAGVDFSTALYNNFGAQKYSPNSSSAKQVTAACGSYQSYANPEVALMSIKRGTGTTGGASISWPAGAEASSYISTTPRVKIDTSVVTASTSDLGATITPNWLTGVNVSDTIETTEPQVHMARLFALTGSYLEGAIPANDVTSSRIFDLYTYDL